ncbi:MAG: hypothetical protein II453_17855 [Alphaproteobacteria bacterium]|nr:hypothetical protein [Alphaproteobacteria bacterium]MBQ3944655.1 hypothetical protein [Alphaproteobacteria bacterium]
MDSNKKREIACEYTGLSIEEIDTIRKFNRFQRNCLFAVIYSLINAIDLSKCGACGCNMDCGRKV